MIRSNLFSLFVILFSVFTATTTNAANDDARKIIILNNTNQTIYIGQAVSDTQKIDFLMQSIPAQAYYVPIANFDAQSYFRIYFKFDQQPLTTKNTKVAEIILGPHSQSVGVSGNQIIINKQYFCMAETPMFPRPDGNIEFTISEC